MSSRGSLLFGVAWVLAVLGASGALRAAIVFSLRRGFAGPGVPPPRAVHTAGGGTMTAAAAAATAAAAAISSPSAGVAPLPLVLPAQQPLAPPDAAVGPSFYERGAAVCAKPGVNVVLARDDTWGVARPTSLRPWSFGARTLHHDRRLPFCASAAALLDSLRLGRRRWRGANDTADTPLPAAAGASAEPYDAADWRARETARSWFAPAGCNPHWFSARAACRVLNAYQHVVVVGDSLTRHLIMGLLAILSGDPVAGAMPPSVYVKHPDFASNCTCDGQFSEHGVCRKMPSPVAEFGASYCNRRLNLTAAAAAAAPAAEAAAILGNNTTPAGGEWEHTFTSAFSYFDPPYIGIGRRTRIPMSGRDPRPVFAYFQGGPHFKMSASNYLKWGYHPTWRLVAKRVPRGVRYVAAYSGVCAQSRSYDEKYPTQTRERAAEFNHELEAALAADNPLHLDFWNLTADAQTSDGFHYLTDVNVFKAQYLLNLMWLEAESPPPTAKPGR